MPVKPYTKEQLENSTPSDRKYPNPFFDLSKNHVPDNIKVLFKYCHSFFHTDPFLSNVIRKITEYPLTDVLYDSEVDTNTRKKYDKVLHEKLKINNLLIEIGLDYNTYGNCFISRYMKFKRYLVDKDTGEKFPVDTIDWKFKNFKFYSVRNGVEKEMGIEDVPINTIESFRLVRWNPSNVDVDYNPITGESDYYYQMPNDLKNRILRGDKNILNTIPALFIESLAKKKKIKFDNKSFYHFKRPGLAESDMGWGKPIVLPAIKKIYYLQVLQRGNEAIAHEHIVPKKAISPANTATLDPLTQLNLPKWKGEIQSAVKKWRKDPNHIAVFPIPVGYQELGGNARGLMTTPEMKFLEETIINSLGVPLEFIKGGASWTGSSISLRIVEKMFMTYRSLLIDFLNHFVVPALKNHLGYPDVKLKFKEFKMSDDNAAKQLVIQLAEMGKLSDPKVLDAFGYNYDEIAKEIEETANEVRDRQVKNQEAQATAQGKSQVIMEKYGIRAKLEAQREHLRVRIEHLQEEIQKERGAVPDNFLDLVQSIAMQVMYLPPEQQIMHMDKLSKKSPTTYALVMETIEMYQNSGIVPGAEGGSVRGAGNPQSRENPPNEKSPGDRESNKSKPREKEKTKGQTRGNPAE